MFVQQGYKLSFTILYGHSRLDRPHEKFCWVYVRLPTHTHYCSKNGLLCYLLFLKDILQKKKKKIFQEVLSLYDNCLVISFFKIGFKIERLVLWMS